MALIFFSISSQFAKTLQELKISSFSEKSVETSKSGVFVATWGGYFGKSEEVDPENASRVPRIRKGLA